MAKSNKMPLSPMLVQYLVGLCALKWDASSVSIEVTVGDMVLDASTGTHRDVDVTVSVDVEDGKYAFKGYEVKRESGPLDVSDVEALATKLNDMPSVTHRAIVSTSGFTWPAVKKAEHHGIELYVIQEWTKPLEEQFPHLTPMKGPPADAIRGVHAVLVWLSYDIWLGTTAPEFEINSRGTLFDEAGHEHPLYSDFGSFVEAMTTRSTRILCWLSPHRSRVEPLMDAARSREREIIEPVWDHSHTLDVRADGVYLGTGSGLHPTDTCTIYGQLSWQFRPILHYVMEKVQTGEPFAGALIAQTGVPGEMVALILSGKDRTFHEAHVELTPRQLNRIHKLRLAMPNDQLRDNSS
ncbi:hypothetical protein [Mycobacterium colombiense]